MFCDTKACIIHGKIVRTFNFYALHLNVYAVILDYASLYSCSKNVLELELRMFML